MWTLKQQKTWKIASHAKRKTCYICRKKLKTPRKYCEKCKKENKIYEGRGLIRGVVRGRDNNTCQACGYVWQGTEKKRLDVHHLNNFCGEKTKSYDKMSDTHNMITVCHKCHYNLHDHRKYGEKSYKT